MFSFADGTMLALCNLQLSRHADPDIGLEANKVLDQFEGKFITIEKGISTASPRPSPPTAKASATSRIIRFKARSDQRRRFGGSESG